MTTYSTLEKNRAIAVCREHGPTEAAKRTGISKTSIIRWARAAGVRTDNPKSRTAAATAAASADARALRLKVAGMTLEGAERVLAIIYARLDAEAHTMPLKDLAVIAGVLVDKHIALERVDGREPDVSAVDAWLDYVMQGEALDATDPRFADT